MSTATERLAVFDPEFQAIKRPYEQIRTSWADNKVPPNSVHTTVKDIAALAGSRTDETLEPFDAWTASQLLPVDWRDPHSASFKPDIPTRKRLVRRAFETLSRIAAKLDDGSTHAAVAADNQVQLFPFHGSQDLVHEVLAAQHYDDEYDTEHEPRKEGVFLRFTGGTAVYASTQFSPITYRVSEGTTYRLPVFTKETHSTHPSANVLPREVNPRLDPQSEKYDPPFVTLGNAEAPVEAAEMRRIFSSDEQRFSLRAAAYLGGCANWLTVEPPGKNFRDLLVTDLSKHAAVLLTKGTGFDAVQRAAAAQTALRRGSLQVPPSHEVADRPLEQIHALLHGAGATVSDVKKRVSQEVTSQPKTMRQLAGKLAIQRSVDEFFAALEETAN